MRGRTQDRVHRATDRGGGRDADGAEPLILWLAVLGPSGHLPVPRLGRNHEPARIAGEQPHYLDAARPSTIRAKGSRPVARETRMDREASR